jgi:SAM-dependent methyltransferase
VDVVISHQSIEHVVDQERVILEMSRVLKPNGLLIVTTPVMGPLGRLTARSRNEQGRRVLSPDHVSEYDSERAIIDSFVRQSGGLLSLMKVKKKSVRVPLGRIFPWLYNRGYIGPTLPAILYYSDVYVVFRRGNSINGNLSQIHSETNA